ncbi:MAG: hypothetical protein AB1420_14305 [Bacillota bacterium]
MKKVKDLLRTLQRNREKIMEIDNVVGVGIGMKEKDGMVTGDQSVVVFVKKKVKKADLRTHQLVPEKLEDNPTDVIEIGEMKLLANIERYRPLRPGCSIGHYAISAGTLGAVVKDKKTGSPLLLSNNHVLANITDGRDGRAKEGDPILQPGAYDGGKADEDVVAHLYRYSPIYKLQTESTCPLAMGAVSVANTIFKAVKPSYSMKLMKTEARDNIIDAALAKPIGIVRDDILEIGRVTGVKDPVLGEKIRKTGRTTGYTEGIVRAVDVTMRVALGQNSFAMFSEQALSNIKSGPGDSGSLILNHENQALGLLFAGSENATLFNKISNVMKGLDITF